ncbi:molybdopterin converting factor subunit 1 [Leeia sp. TBRC 13508]|uniref:Molybdopterin synthase sulfur carrier subunit n=1 Tax=Leeia speluncae TaxID=2884804 RepID=A0ABS8D8B9_9NEIS|nr:molybdopterin converting factor subunit 1 [Leeia speluncae]MCB6184382.1 molybdopterin converting factor subunit 1 [Leeia speluncae]
MKNLKLLYFARLRESFGRETEEIVLPDEVATVGQLIQYLAKRGGAWENELGEDKIFRVAVNQTISTAESELPDSAEVAIFPPVTGG